MIKGEVESEEPSGAIRNDGLAVSSGGAIPVTINNTISETNKNGKSFIHCNKNLCAWFEKLKNGISRLK